MSVDIESKENKELYERYRAAALSLSTKRDRRIAYFPQYKQFIMESCNEYEGFYGGAAGGGKTDYLVMEALHQVQIPNYRGIIFRKTYPELSEVEDKQYHYYKTAFPKARYNQQRHVWTFPSGAKIYNGSMQHTKDRTKYQGRQFDFIGFDELTHFTFDEYSYMYSRNRASGPGTKVYMRSTGNPGGIGHGWVKQYFVTAARPGYTVTNRMPIIFPDGSVKVYTRDRIFIPSSVFDNERLLQNSPEYLASLYMLPEQERKALMDGNWDIFSGQVFMEFRNNPDGYRNRKWTHVIEPFEIPESWNIYRGFDFGYSKPFSVGWYAMSPDGVMFRVRGLYGCQKGRDGRSIPNTGVMWDAGRIAREIALREREDRNLKGHNIIGIADPAIFEASNGESIADLMAREGVYFTKGDHKRLPGKMQCHYRLRFDQNGYPSFYVFNTDSNFDFLRTVPALVYDETNVEDVDSDGEDHIYDEWRYVCMARPISYTPEEEKEYSEFDPLGLNQDLMHGGFNTWQM